MTSSTHCALAASAILALVPPGGDERDTVHLTNGKQLRGRVVLELDDRIFLRVGTREREIRRDQVDRIDSLARRQAELLERYRTMDPQSADSLVALAGDAEKASLPHEAQLFRWRAVLLDPDHAPAHEALGHDRRGDEWRLVCGRRKLSLDDVIRANNGAFYGQAKDY